MPRTRTPKLEYLAHETGLWCNTCMLSTGIAIWVVVTDPSGTTIMDATLCIEEGDVDHDVVQRCRPG